MPGGLENIGLGYATYAGIKFVGYSLAGIVLNRVQVSKKTPFLLFGAIRTVLGLVIGAGYGVLFLLPASLLGDIGLSIFLLGLVPLRFFEWWVTFKALYEGQMTSLKFLVVASAWSFVLGVPAIAGLLQTGGLWIC